MQRSARRRVAFFLNGASQGRPLIQVMYIIQSKRKVAFRPSANFAQALRAFEEQVRRQILPVVAPQMAL
jgi:hypothetical protein